jgi:ankyrin repeat protein
VEGGADLNARDGNFNGTPLQWAEQHGADESAKLLKELGA